MSGRTVSVLAPNGRRQTVKCTLNTTILHILEEVCKKQGFNPEEYDIKHHNKALDTSMTIQFSGLPNNAQLELGPVSKVRAESEVTVALNLEDGRRVLGTFSPLNTLQDVLSSLCDIQEPNPIVIYMRRELYGDDLVRTDLRSLGLTSGRALFRVVHKSPEELKNQANVSSVIPPKPVEEKPYKRVFQPLESTDDMKSSSNSCQEETRSPEPKKILPTPKNVPAQPDVLKLAKERNKISQKDTADSSERVLKSEKGRTFKKEGKPSETEECPPKIETSPSIDSRTGKDYLDSVNLEDLPYIGDRKGLIFTLESAQSRLHEDPPDEFFNLTVEDAKTILRDIRRTREEAEEGGPLLTAALRKLEESKKQLRQLNKYNKSIIRVLFPDRTVLQAVFSPTDFVKSVSEFVAQHLSNSHIPFYLYTTPPKYILPEDKRLIEVDCVPGALLHFGIDDQYKNVLTFLREDLKDKFTTNSMASLAALKIREESRRSRKKSDEDATETFPVAGCSKEQDDLIPSQVKRNSNTTENVPKWFKGT